MTLSPALRHRHFSDRVWLTDPEMGRIYLPQDLLRLVSLPGRPTHGAKPGEYGLFLSKQHRPVRREDGLLLRHEMIWTSFDHNERVDEGAVIQDAACFTGGSINAFINIAIASASITVAHGDLSLGSASANATTNEFTTIGLSRAAGSLGSYTAPVSLGAQFSRIISKLMTASGSGTAYGAGLFDSATVVGSHLYVELLYSNGSAVLVTSDTITTTATISN